MVLIGDSTYVKNHPADFRNNSYEHKDQAFDGRLLYYSVNGQFLAGWRFEKGRIIKTISSKEGSNEAVKVTSIGKVRLVQTCNITPVTTVTIQCITYESANGNYTTCTPHYSYSYLIECSTSTGDSGGGSGGSDGSGGNSFPPPPSPPPTPPVQTPETPCSQAQKNASNINLKKKLAALKSAVTNDPTHEHAYTYVTTNDQSTYAESIGTENGEVDFTNIATGQIDGVLHDHYTNSNNASAMYPIFSIGDVAMLSILQSQGHIKNTNSFTFGVVTATGTYTLAIEDISQFNSYSSNHFTSQEAFNDLENTFEHNVQKYQLLGKDQQTSYELGFLDTIKSSGLSLFKGDLNTFGAWNKVTNTNNQVTTVPCPTTTNAN